MGQAILRRQGSSQRTAPEVLRATRSTRRLTSRSDPSSAPTTKQTRLQAGDHWNQGCEILVVAAICLLKLGNVPPTMRVAHSGSKRDFEIPCRQTSRTQYANPAVVFQSGGSSR